MKVAKWLPVVIVGIFLLVVSVPHFLSFANVEDGKQQEVTSDETLNPDPQEEGAQKTEVKEKDLRGYEPGDSVPMEVSVLGADDNKLFDDKDGKYKDYDRDVKYNPVTGETNCPEDSKILVGENSVIFDESAVDDDAKDGDEPELKLGEPLPSWTQTPVDDDGNELGEGEKVSDGNTECTPGTTNPGKYSLGNHAVRPIEGKDPVGGTSDEISEEEYKGLVDKGLVKDGDVITKQDVKKLEDLNEEQRKAVEESRKAAQDVFNSGQNVRLAIHDVTPPDLWIALKECVGDVVDTDGLQEKLDEAIVAHQGSPSPQESYDLWKYKYEKARYDAMKGGKVQPQVVEHPDSKKDKAVTLDSIKKDYGVSVITIDEGKLGKYSLVEEADKDGNIIEKPTFGDSERDKRPNKKDVRVTFDGYIFDKNGRRVKAAGNSGTKSIDGLIWKREAKVEFDPSNPDVPDGLYVRKNVPLKIVVSALDNGNKRKRTLDSENIRWLIRDKNSDTVVYAGKNDLAEGFSFRVPNYPREKYSDQPDYELVVEAIDDSGKSIKIPGNPDEGDWNMTRFTSPLYVIDTKMNIDSTGR